MSYIAGLSAVRRRHPVKQLTGPEAIAELNRIVDQTNDAIAKIEVRARLMEGTARLYEAENIKLRAQVAELEKQVKRMAAKAGKRKGRRNGPIESGPDPE